MPELRIRLAGYQPARSILTRGLHRIADTLQENLGAQVDIVLTDSITATGRRADDLLTMVEGDALDICYFSSSYLAARVPSLGLFDRPFRFADRAAAHAELAGPKCATACRGRGTGDRLPRAGVLGQRHPAHLQSPAPDPPAGRLRGASHPHRQQRRAPGVFPPPRLRAGVHRHPRSVASSRRRHRRCAGKSADQHRQFRDAAAPPLRLADRASVRASRCCWSIASGSTVGRPRCVPPSLPPRMRPPRHSGKTPWPRTSFATGDLPPRVSRSFPPPTSTAPPSNRRPADGITPPRQSANTLIFGSNSALGTARQSPCAASAGPFLPHRLVVYVGAFTRPSNDR